MSKHVSRFLISPSSFRQFLSHQSCRPARHQQARFQHSSPKPPMPLGDKRMSGWQKLALCTALIGGCGGFAFYVVKEKEMSKQ